jgi:hypothetical protein
MIMRKRKALPPRKSFSPSRTTLVLYIIGMLTISVPLFYLIISLTAKDTLTVFELRYYAAALEYILAGITLLTGGCYLVERVVRTSREKE